MTDFKINGMEREAPVALDENFEVLIQFVHENLVSETSLISSVKVNGVEISDSDEKALSSVPLSEIDSVEIDFAHPREVAEETLQTLKLFTDQLISLSQRIAGDLGSKQADQEFQNLIDGIQTFSDTIVHVRRILRIGLLGTVNVLEADLVSILKDLLQTHHSKDLTYRTALLHEHLPTNLTQWRDEGIPAMIRSRDS